MNIDKVVEDSLLEAAKILRNCRKIEHRIYQLQKQLYLGHTSAYNILLKTIYPNYDEHHKEGFKNTPLMDNPVLTKIETEIDDGDTRTGTKTGSKR